MDKMRFTKELKATLLERFNYKNRIRGRVYMIKVECPLCRKYKEEECLKCKLIHHHKCLQTLHEINDGCLHFGVSRECIAWAPQDMDVVKKELTKICRAIRNSDIIA